MSYAFSRAQENSLRFVKHCKANYCNDSIYWHHGPTLLFIIVYRAMLSSTLLDFI